MVIHKQDYKNKFYDLQVDLELCKKENKKLTKQRHSIKNVLFNFRQSCYKEMRVVNSELVLTNTKFNKLFETLISKFRKEQAPEVKK